MKEIREITRHLLRAIMDRFPNEITISDYACDRWVRAIVPGNIFNAPTFEKLTLDFGKWIETFGLENIRLEMCGLTEKGRPVCLHEMTSMEFFYQSLEDYYRKNHMKFIKKGKILFSKNGVIQGIKQFDGTDTVFKNEILYQFFPTAPCYIPEGTNEAVSRENIVQMTGGDQEIAWEVFKKATWMPIQSILGDL